MLHYVVFHFQSFTSETIPKNYLPSLLRMLELTVQANILIRISTCVPNALRLLQSYLVAVMNDYIQTSKNFVYCFCNGITPILLFTEIIACTIFSINTIRLDYQGISV